MNRSTMLFATLAGAVSAGMATPAQAGGCSARSGPTVNPVVELYTSEGCNSCPPADRWLVALKQRPDVVALAFHVDYWDRLGWKDRFASPRFTQRQLEQLPVNGARFAYTPQVVVDGQDRKDWPRLDWRGARPPAQVGITLERDGDQVRARVSAGAAAPARLAAHWALTESGHRTAVKAGENVGVTLEHDFVVRRWEAVPAWAVLRGEAHALSFALPRGAELVAGRRINLLVIDVAHGRPVQALAADC
jgi:hypothetical protein